jgi:anaerobic selenocysteine-containing dehydrogenase
MSETHYRTCNLCEAVCGIAIEHENGKVLKIEGDKADPFSHGHICPKAISLKDIYLDPNRLKVPVKKTADGWQEISWEEAFDEVANRIKAIQAEHGLDAVAVYQGNPSVHNLGTMLNSRELLKALKTKNNYSATSVDQLPHHFASWAMFGHPFLIPIPDIDRTDFFLIFGGNPITSNGSLMTAPDVANRLATVKQRGKVIVIDPRKTETAQRASEHFFIKPGRDVYLLLAIVNTLFAEGLVKPERLLDFTDGIEQLKEISAVFTPESAEKLTGISAVEIRRLTREFAGAERAVCYGRMGISVQKFGGLCNWLISSINILTGNFDRQGGAMFTAPAFDFVALAKMGENIYNRWHSRVRGLPEFMSELPVAALAEEMLTTGEGQIKALITSCGNPVLSTPNGRQMDKALRKLNFMVSIDIYINETTRHADIILPPATGLENSHYDIVFNSFAVRNVAKYSPPLFPKTDGAKFDWEIFQELTHRLNGNSKGLITQPPEVKLEMALQFGPYGLSLDKLKSEPHGIDLGELKPCLPERLMTSDKRINLAPRVFVNDIARLKKEADSAADPEFPFLLIGRRHLRDCNSWLHNTERMMKGKNRCTVMINPADAAGLKVTDKQVVSVSSRVGKIELPAEITEDIAPGTLSIPHGYGHNRDGVKLDVASRFAGVSINDLTNETVLDELTGNAAFSNVRVKIQP